MEISQIEPRLEDTQDEYEKAQKFKEYVQGIFIENNSQDEFKRRVDAIFNETFKGERRWMKMPMSRDDHLFLKEHVSETIFYFLFISLLIIIVLLGIIVYKI